MKKSPLVSITIATYNRWDLLERCLIAIQNQSYQPIEVIVVDNGTDQATVDGVHQFPFVTYVKAKTNLGFAGGYNLAANHAKGIYVFPLNNDAFIGKNTLKETVEYLEANPAVAIAQPTILIDEPGKPATKSNGAGSFLTQWGFLWHRGFRDAKATLPKQTDLILTALGAGMLIRREVIQKHGQFDESFFAYFEETDLCWRLWTRGYQVAYVPTDPMTHLGGQTARVFNERLVIFFAYRNRLISLWRHLELRNLVPILLRHNLSILGLILVLLPKRPKASGWLLVTLGWELTHLGLLLRTRREHLKKRTVGDQQIWPTIYRARSLTDMARYL